MTAIGVKSEPAREGLRPTNLRRDLREIADLIEICFADQLDGGDLAAVREMRTLSSLGPLLWLLGALDTSGFGLGFVWLDGGRVVGNVSTVRAGHGLRGLGMGWVVANVAVHPDWRRRGIARALMEAALDFIIRGGGRWVVLQVDHSNLGARALYERLGFEDVGRLTVWRHGGALRADAFPARPMADSYVPRIRRASEWEAEMRLAARDRASELAWTRPLERSHFKQGPLGAAWTALNGQSAERWMVDGDDGFLGGMWLEPRPWSAPRVTLFLDPEADQPAVGLALLREAARRVSGRRHVRVEVSDRDPALAAELEGLGFRALRTLTQMRWVPTQMAATRQ